jgi:predicted TIM-barrel fold metal-dependent hydrolase
MKKTDADVHVRWETDAEMLAYLPKVWHSRWLSGAGHTQSGLRIQPKYYNPLEPALEVSDLKSVNPHAVHDPSALVKDWLDRWDFEAVFLSCFDALGISTFGDIDYPIELARMHNRWLTDKFLCSDTRFWGSIIVATQDPEAAATEIRRAAASHPGMVRLLLPTGTRQPYGHRFYLPIFNAAADCGLDIAIHAGTEGVGTSSPPTPAGWPVTLAELRVSRATHALGHLTSMVTEGLFQRFPEMRVTFLECGVAWLVPYLWRFDKNYKGLRSECPWLTELPSELVCRHFRFGTQGAEPAPDPAEFWRLLESLPSADLMIFASNYPRWDMETPENAPALRGCDEERLRKIFYR